MRFSTARLGLQVTRLGDLVRLTELTIRPGRYADTWGIPPECWVS